MNDRKRGASPDPQDGRPLSGMDHLLRDAVASDDRAVPSECLDAETLASWSEGVLSRSERSFAEAHAARCARCQAMLAVMVRTVPAEGLASPPYFRKWLIRLGPALAAAAAVALWFAVEPRQREDISSAVQSRSSSDAPAVPLAAPPAERDTAERAREGPSGAPAEAKKEAQDKLTPVSPRRESPSSLADASSAKKEGYARSAEPPRAVAEIVAVPKPVEPTTVGGVAQPEQARQRLQAGQQTQQSAQQNTQQNAQPNPQQNAQQNMVVTALPAVQPLPPAAPNAKPAAATDAQSRGDRAAADNTAGFLGKTSTGTRAGAGRGGAATGANEERLTRSLFAPLVVAVPDSAIQWRVDAGRIVQHSIDGGASWDIQYMADPQTVLVAGASLSPSVCWLVGRAGAILATADGRTWRRVPFVEAVDLVAVIPTDARRAIVITVDNRTFTTTDGGERWIVRKD